MLAKLITRFPNVNKEHLSALADVWQAELDLVMRRMIDIVNMDGLGMPSKAYDEVLFELAKLGIWLADRIIEWKTLKKELARYDPETEKTLLDAPTTRARIENTAQILAERIWRKKREEWWKRFPALGQKRKRRPRILGSRKQEPVVRRQHFSPDSTNVRWAVNNRICVYSRGIDGDIVCKETKTSQWGRQELLYSHKLEHYLSLVEGDAGVPYKKLLETVPLSGKDCLHWVAFLVCQMFRTPACIARVLPYIKQHVEESSANFPTHLASLRDVYETVFSNNRIFAASHRLITGHRWKLCNAARGSEFIRSDDPVLIHGSTKTNDWHMIYPMAPGRCFVAGPEKHAPGPEAAPQVLPEIRQLDASETEHVNHLVAWSARRSVISSVSANSADLRSVLKRSLARKWDGLAASGAVLQELWSE